MPVITAFIIIEVAINAFKGPIPAEGSISRGRMRRLQQNIPRGGIQNDFIIFDILILLLHTY
jgi:hypothetical protein